jgi:hypothetical protein
MQYYSNRKYTVTVVSRENGTVKLRTIDGFTYELTEERFKEYLTVDVVEEKPVRKKFKEMSPFEQQEIEKMYAQSWVTDDDTYISNELVKNKAL